MSKLDIALIQTDVYWENVTANLASLEEKIANIVPSFDLLVLPEMFNTGFTMNGNMAEPPNFTTTRWMKQMAAKTGSLVIGSLPLKENASLYNRLLCVFPNGKIERYDKRHLFTLSKENETYTSGTSRLIVEWKGWRICPLICYDLRFPVWSRNSAANPYDLLIYVANWPLVRSDAWKILIRARALENQSFVVGVNRIGEDVNGLQHKGDSRAYDYNGTLLVDLGHESRETVLRISKTPLVEHRKAFPFLSDADDFAMPPLLVP